MGTEQEAFGLVLTVALADETLGPGTGTQVGQASPVYIINLAAQHQARLPPFLVAGASWGSEGSMNPGGQYNLVSLLPSDLLYRRDSL